MATQAKSNVTNATKATTNAAFNLVSIKKAIEVSHDELGNRAAISVKGMEDAGVTLTEQTLNQWVAYCEDLRKAVITYATLSHKQDATDKALATARGKVEAKWREVIKEGTEQDFDKRFFIRKGDVIHLVGLCGEYFQNSGKGKQIACREQAAFRKNVETLIGVRLAGNGMLSEEDRDTIKSYESAQKTIKRCTDLLDGYTDSKKQKVDGLKKKLDGATAKLSKVMSKVEKLKMSKDDLKEFLAEYYAPINLYKTAIEEAEKSLEAARKVESEKKDEYEKVMTTLKVAGLDD